MEFLGRRRLGPIRSDFPGPDSSFSGVAAVAMTKRNALEIDVVFFESFLEFVGASLVFKYVEFGFKAIVLKIFMKLDPCVGKLAGLARFKRLGEDGVAVVDVEDHGVLISAGGLNCKQTCLFGVGFS